MFLMMVMSKKAEKIVALNVLACATLRKISCPAGTSNLSGKLAQRDSKRAVEFK